jgi:hypothetical protein
MMSTHTAYGFVAAYSLALIFSIVVPSAYTAVMPVTAWLVLSGVFGGFFPDIDQLEFWGPQQIRKYFVHKKTLHYITGYFVAMAILTSLAVFYPQYLLWLLGLACASLGAGVHSLMDPLDGWRDDHPEQGIYEHLRRKWIPSLRLVMFAGMWEWVIQAFAAIWFIAISANLSQLFLPGWKLGTVIYFFIWGISAVFDAHYVAPKRQSREIDYIRSLSELLEKKTESPTSSQAL